MENSEIQGLNNSKGIYICIFKLDFEQDINVGKMGLHFFKKGFYLYVGSAFGGGGLKARILRHSEKSTKIHWHIDYLKSLSSFVGCYIKLTDLTEEHKTASHLSELFEIPVKGFGSSDCKCSTHLFYQSY
ncbi:MAG: GIY-YIG nuclease family protein [Ignavibacteriaceae bacterium]|nr:GIY-YIG nuclease family protein [Ignavibacteriaceae bacterium]